MSVLSIFEAVPNRVQALAQIVAAEGQLTKAELKKRIQPNIEKTDQFNNLLRESLRIGILSDGGGNANVQLGESVTKKLVSKHELFREFCFKKLIGGELDEKDENQVFAKALAWLLVRSTGFETPWGDEFAQLLRKDLQGDDNYSLTNVGRSQMLGYWAQYLGFMEWTTFKNKTYCCPDPSRALATLSEELRKKRSDFSVSEFLKKMSSRASVIETGNIRNEVEARLKTPRGEHELSLSTSLALTRLELRGLIELKSLSDAETWMLTVFGDKPRTISHIKLLGR